MYGYYLFVISILADSYIMCTIIIINNIYVCKFIYERRIWNLIMVIHCVSEMSYIRS